MKNNIFIHEIYFFIHSDPHVDHAVQQTGFLRVKRGYGMPKAGLDSDDLALTASKKSPWVSLREALDGGLQVKQLFKDLVNVDCE